MNPSRNNSQTQLTFLGTGTSHGVPMIACDCAVCTSDDPRDSRMRSSLLVKSPRGTLLIDTTPELRLQCIAHRVTHIDAILFTHTHADHVRGLDAVRRFCYLAGKPIDCYGSPTAIAALKRIFAYAFVDLNEAYSERPRLNGVEVTAPFDLCGETITPLPMKHGLADVTGYRFGNWAYCTDVSFIPPATESLMADLDVLILDALRYTPHPTHFSVDQALAVVKRLRPKRTYFTHIAHEIGHQRLQSELPDGVFVAYDGLTLTYDADKRQWQ